MQSLYVLLNLKVCWRCFLRLDSESMCSEVRNGRIVACFCNGKFVAQLALEIGLSIEMLDKLDQHSIDTATIPKELCKRLANALQQSLSVIEI